VPRLADLIQAATEDEPLDLELATLGSDLPQQPELVVSGWVRSGLAPIAGALFYRRGMGIVIGLLLGYGHQVVLKVHRWLASISRRTAVRAVQQHLAKHGLPVPLPLLAPEALGSGVVTAEQMRSGVSADADDLEIRKSMAETLARFVLEARPLTGLAAGLGQAVLLAPPSGAHWPEP
jgi:hypothetical protein